MLALSLFAFIVTMLAVEGNKTTPSPYEITNQNDGLLSTHPTTSLYEATNTTTQLLKDDHAISTSTSSCTLVCNETTLETNDLGTIVSSNIIMDSIQVDEEIPLYIISLYEGPGGGWEGSGVVPAIQMAMDDINDREDILPEYELRPIWDNTKVKCVVFFLFIADFDCLKCSLCYWFMM